ncbi:MAG: flagellar biosynthesis anti-sigma factor FlgM [Gallionellaceae bacterium]|jgi:negative regulator of flagellin synthesis FlgM
MKIEKSNNSLPPSSLSESTARAAAPKTADSQASPDGVSVTLGSATNQMRSMEVNIANAPMVDAKKVAEIKQAISEGRFKINSEAIADGLINNVEDMIGASDTMDTRDMISASRS